MRSGNWLTPALLAGAFVALLVQEHRRPLRARAAPAGQRLARNLATGLLAAVLVAAPNALVTRPATTLV